ncbi:MAG: ribosome silencing factor [Planctomycetota bacterium]
MTDIDRQAAGPDTTAAPGNPGSATHRAADTTRPTPEQMARIAARTGDQRKAGDIRVLNVSANSSITDYFVIMTGFNRRQIQSIAWELDKEMKSLGVKKLGMEGYETAWWVLIDYGSVVVHIFHADAREYYDIDMLQGDAVLMDWATDDAVLTPVRKRADDPREPQEGSAMAAPHGEGDVTNDYEPVPKPEDARDSGITAEDLAGIDVDSLTPIEDADDDDHDDDDNDDDDDDDRN